MVRVKSALAREKIVLRAECPGWTLRFGVTLLVRGTRRKAFTQQILTEAIVSASTKGYLITCLLAKHRCLVTGARVSVRLSCTLSIIEVD